MFGIDDAFIGWLVSTIVSMLISYVIAEITRDDPDFGDKTDPGTKVRGNTKSTQEVVRVNYGEVFTGGNDVFIEGAGPDNEDLWVVQTLGEGECDSLLDVKLAGKPVADYGGNVDYTFYPGSASQVVDPALHAAIPKYTDNLRHTAHIIWKFHFERKYFAGLPKRQSLWRGLKVFDFRDLTTGWSQNPVLCLADYFCSSRYGMGKDINKIDLDSWTAVADYCDVMGWKLNLSIVELKPGWDIVNQICRHFNGKMTWFDGKYYLRILDLHHSSNSSVLTIIDEHVAVDDQGNLQIGISQPSRFGKPDGLRVKWTDPARDYVLDDFIVGNKNGVVNDFSVTGCHDRSQATALGIYSLERQQLDRAVALLGRDDLIELEPYDVVTLDNSELGISDQLMRVTGCPIQPNGQIDLSLQFEDMSLYDQDINLVTEGIYRCNLPDPHGVVPPVINVLVTEEQYEVRLRTFTRLKVSFDRPDYPWFDKVRVYRSVDNVIWNHEFDATDDFSVEPVEEGQTIWLRLKTINIQSHETDDNQDYKIQYLVQGQNAAPPSLASLDVIVNENTINLYAARLDSADIELYEFRLGLTWAAGIFMDAMRAPNLSRVGVKPGQHTFWANSFATNGQYGATPRSTSASLQDPPDGWTVMATVTDDYSGGTHDNTEQTIYINEPHLHCTHTAGNLKGTYLGPVIDRGAVERYLIYCLLDLTVLGGGTRWSDQIPNLVTPILSWDFLNSEDGWTAVGATIILNAYTVTIEANTADPMYRSPTFSIPGGANTIVQARVKRINSGSGQMVCFYVTNEHGESGSFYKYIPDTTIVGEWVVLEWDMGDLNQGGTDWIDNDILQIRLDFANEIDVIFELDWVVIGNRSSWQDAGFDRLWRSIFVMGEAPRIPMRLHYGSASVAEHVIEKMELMTALAEGRYFQFEIEINDPSIATEALLGEYEMKFCQKG